MIQRRPICQSEPRLHAHCHWSKLILFLPFFSYSKNNLFVKKTHITKEISIRRCLCVFINISWAGCRCSRALCRCIAILFTYIYCDFIFCTRHGIRNGVLSQFIPALKYLYRCYKLMQILICPECRKKIPVQTAIKLVPGECRKIVVKWRRETSNNDDLLGERKIAYSDDESCVLYGNVVGTELLCLYALASASNFILTIKWRCVVRKV